MFRKKLIMLYDICIHSGASIESGLVFANLYREMLKRGKKILLYTSSKKVVEFWNEEGIKDYVTKYLAASNPYL